MGFPLVKIDSVSVFIRNGLSIKQEDGSGGDPITRIETIAERTINLDKCGYAGISYLDYEDYLLRKNDILISHINSEKHLGKSAIYRETNKLIHGMNLLCLRVDTNLVDANYVFRIISAQEFLVGLVKITKKSVNQASFSASDFKNLEIPLPPLPIQRHIARVLDQADQLRKQAQQMETELNQLAQAVFLEMFGDPVTNPKGWKLITLNELGEVQGGLQVTEKRKDNPIEKPYLRVANVFRDYINLDEVKNLRVTEAEFERTKLVTGDILIVEGHGNIEEIGRCAVWDGQVEDCIHQNHLIRFRADSTKANPVFLSAFLNSEGGRLQLIGSSRTTSGLNTISSRNVKESEVFLPDISLQNKYERAIKGILAKKQLNQSVLSELNTLFHSLVQKAFKGELIPTTMEHAA